MYNFILFCQPPVAHNDAGYFSYFITEQPVDWQGQLRFPLLQQYLADYNINCDVAEMHIGMYCLETGRFEFKSFTKEQLHKTVLQTSALFEKISNEYSKIKPNAVR